MNATVASLFFILDDFVIFFKEGFGFVCTVNGHKKKSLNAFSIIVIQVAYVEMLSLYAGTAGS